MLTIQVLLIFGDTERNPGPKKSSAIKFCHWNLNGLAPSWLCKGTFDRDFQNCAQFVSQSETFLNSPITHNYEKLVN